MSCDIVYPETHTTIHLLSDGNLLYWLYVLKQQETSTNTISGDKIKYHNVYLQVLELNVMAVYPFFHSFIHISIHHLSSYSFICPSSSYLSILRRRMMVVLRFVLNLIDFYFKRAFQMTVKDLIWSRH